MKAFHTHLPRCSQHFLRQFFLPLFLLLVFGGAARKTTAKNTPPPAPVRVESVTRADVPRLLHGSGQRACVLICGRKTPRYRRDTAGSLYRRAGRARGRPAYQLLIRAPLRHLREKKGQLAKSQAQLAKAIDDMNRYGKLVGSGYVSRDAYEKPPPRPQPCAPPCNLTKPVWKAPPSTSATARWWPPSAGAVGALSVDKGNMVKAADATVIVNIDTLSPIYVGFSCQKCTCL